MRARERKALRQRFEFRCGYCGVHEQDAGAELTVDHFRPRSQGGSHDSANLVYCCHACNEFKGDIWQPDSTDRILHPLNDDISAHLAEAKDGLLTAKTLTGAFHIERLRLNRPQLVAYRHERQLLRTSRDAQDRLLAGLRLLEQDLETLTRQLEELGREGPER